MFAPIPSFLENEGRDSELTEAQLERELKEAFYTSCPDAWSSGDRPRTVCAIAAIQLLCAHLEQEKYIHELSQVRVDELCV